MKDLDFTKTLAIRSPGSRMSKDQLNWLGTHAQSSKIILELGTYCGRSARMLADNAPDDAIVYCVDSWRAWGRQQIDAEPFYQKTLLNLEDHIKTGKVIVHRNTFVDVLPKIAHLEGLVDMLWIDGGHKYASMKTHCPMFVPLVRPGGLVCGHDYNLSHSGLRRAVDEMYPHRQIAASELWWFRKDE